MKIDDETRLRIRHKLLNMAGEASMCWHPRPLMTLAFSGGEAVEIVERYIADLVLMLEAL